jgi:hypothetical protein
MGSEELPPAKAALRKRAKPWYKRSQRFLIVLFLLVAIVIFCNHNAVEGEMVTGSAVGAAAAENASSLNVEGLPKSVEEIVEAREHAAEAAKEAKEVGGAAAAALTAKPSAATEEVAELRLSVAGGAQDLRLRLRLLPQHSESSVAFVREAATANCVGELYRSERDFLVQGRIDCGAQRHAGAVTTVVSKGGCPPGIQADPHRQCPSHDPNCGCHGPIMGHGMVGWAGGSAGPDFFIYIGKGEARHWAHDHTVFAEVADAASWEAIEALGRLPVKTGGMTFFQDKIRLKVATPDAP